MKQFPILTLLCALPCPGCGSGNHESAVSYDNMPYGEDVYGYASGYASGGSYETAAAEEPYFESGTADFSEVVYEEAQIAESRSAGSRVAPARADQANPANPVPTSEVPEVKKIIKTGNMGIRVSRIDEARRQVDSLVAVFGGYYSEENYSDGNVSELTMAILVPFGYFDTFTAALEKGGGRVLYKNIAARDVSEEYLDTEIRLANERYREILKRANTIEEILQVEQYVHRLEVEIESAQGRLRYLDHRTAYSTLTLTLSTEQLPVPTKSRFWSRVTHALSEGWDGVVSFVIGLLYLWPFLLIGGGVWFWLRRLLKRRKQRRDDPTE